MSARKAIDYFRHPAAPRTILSAGFLTGAIFFVFYHVQQLTVAHYDAKAHLVVARRILDSLEPGYSQIGISWLPLIHLIYLPFVIFDSQYRSGLLPSLISVAAFSLSGWLVFQISYRVTRSVAAGFFAAVILLANPNLLYLQSCPLTEPMFMVLFLMAIDRLMLWRESDRISMPWSAAIWTSLAGLCRYEGWIFFAGVLFLLTCDFWTRYIPKPKALKAGALYCAFFGIPVAAHFSYIFLRLGGAFFLRVVEGNPDPYLTHKRPFLSLFYHLGEVTQMAGALPLLAAAAGILMFLFQRTEWKRRMPLWLLWMPSLINISALYWGHIYRLRYSVLLLPAVGIFGSLAVASAGAKRRVLILLATVATILPWFSWYFFDLARGNIFTPGPGLLWLPAATLVLFLIARAKKWYDWILPFLCVLGMHIPVLNAENRPMMAEALEHEFIEPERQQILKHIGQFYEGRKILIDMGRLAPLVYDSGLPVKEFVYNEGMGVLWHTAMRQPDSVVEWICTQDGDAVSRHMAANPGWADKYSLEVGTAHLSLYRLKR